MMPILSKLILLVMKNGVRHMVESNMILSILFSKQPMEDILLLEIAIALGMVEMMPI